MARWISFVAFTMLLVVGWFFFELANIWPINQDKVELLRALFGGFSFLALCALLFSRLRLLPAALTAGAFASTSAISNAGFNLMYLSIAGVIVLAVALLRRPFAAPLKVR